MVGSPCSPRDSQESSPTPQFKSINSLVLSFLHSPTLTPYMTTGKTIALTRRTFVGKVMSLLLNMLSRLVITFLLRSKRLLISWLQSLSAVILEPKKIKTDTFHCFPIYFPWSDGMDIMPWTLTKLKVKAENCLSRWHHWVSRNRALWCVNLEIFPVPPQSPAHWHSSQEKPSLAVSWEDWHPLMLS